MDNTTNGGIIGLVFAALTGAIGYLYRELRKAPRPEEHQRLISDCDKLKAIVDAAAEEARRTLAEREAENRKLEAKIIRLESAVSRIGKRDG